MNCPSRNDDVELHPDWNQNPPMFAADLTTCEDMNGIANARELEDAERLCSGLRGLRQSTFDDSTFKENGRSSLVLGKGAKRFFTGMSVP